MDAKRQQVYEQAYARTIDFLYSTHGYRAIFIAMAHNEIEENDVPVALRIQGMLQDPTALEIVTPKSFREVQAIVAGSQFGIHTRMHAAILSCTQYTPFVLVGYGHKSRGLASLIGIEDCYIDIEQVDEASLLSLTEHVLRPEVQKHFTDRLYAYYSIAQTSRLRLLADLRQFVQNI